MVPPRCDAQNNPKPYGCQLWKQVSEGNSTAVVQFDDLLIQCVAAIGECMGCMDVELHLGVLCDVSALKVIDLQLNKH